MTARVTVIVLNWNGASHLAACLDSVDRLTYPACERVVVDNASIDGSLQRLQTDLTGVDELFYQRDAA